MLRATKRRVRAAAAAKGSLRRRRLRLRSESRKFIAGHIKKIKKTRRGTHAHHLTVGVMIISSCCHNKVQAGSGSNFYCGMRVARWVTCCSSLPPSTFPSTVLSFFFFMTRRCCLCRFNVNFRHFILRKIDKDRTTTAAAAAAWVVHFHLPLTRRFSFCSHSFVVSLFPLSLCLCWPTSTSGYLTRLWSHWSGQKNNERNSQENNWSNSAAHEQTQHRWIF